MAKNAFFFPQLHLLRMVSIFLLAAVSLQLPMPYFTIRLLHCGPQLEEIQALKRVKMVATHLLAMSCVENIDALKPAFISN